ncbi:MAG TPA: isoprenylcysteine carboxylmethyltransferase family protein [Stellaceae bacterium]|nr:isoprenylcysteine carboxylmethyltransferase family protein [Stellaceae bacterium]
MSQAVQQPFVPGPPTYEWLVNRAVTAWFLFLAYFMGASLVEHATQLHAAPGALDVHAIADLLSRACMLMFFCLAAWLTLVRAQPLAKASGLKPRIAALVSVTVLFAVPLCPHLVNPPTWLLFLSAGMILFGNVLALLVLNRLGKSFSVMAEARRLVTDGPYRIVRHPLYATEGIAIIGIFLPYLSVQAALLFALQVALQLIRMHYEEQVLRRTFPEYADYARHTRRLIPGVW